MRAAGRSRFVYLALIAAMASAALGTGLVASAGAQEIRDADIVPGSYIVVYKDSVTSPGKATAQREQQLDFERDYLYRDAVQGFAADLSPRQIGSLASDPRVDFISENRRVEAAGDVGAKANLPLAPGEPVPPTGVRRILAGTSTTVREAGANTAVIDTGIQLNHPDLNAAAGTDCINPGTPPDDGDGHGTHVAGTIGAKNNGSGVTGVAPNTKVYAVRVLNNKGSGTTASIICGVDWVTANKAAENIQVANMSLGGLGPAQGTETCATTTDAWRAAICRSTAAGVRYVVAAGNDSWDFDYPPVPDVPAVYPEVMTVTAIADSDGTPGGSGPSTNCGWVVADDTPAPFSNFALTPAGEAHTIAAPGVCINSTVPGSTWDSNYSGTSMASPHVAGVVALCVSEAGVDGPCASLTPAQTIAHVRTEAQTYNTANPDYGFAGDPISSPGDEYYGFLTFTINPPVQRTLTAAKAGTGQGTITSSPAGINCGADCSEAYNDGTVVTLTATATAGSTFTGWSGAGCSGTGTCQVTVNSDQTATATFTINPPVQRTLTAAKAGTGQGTITSSPAGINCGADCSEAYNDGTVVTLTATATAGSTFTGWSGAGCSGTGTCQVTVNSDQTATATFTINPPVQRTLTAAKAGTGQGTITSSPAGINCGADCSEAYNDGTVVTLTATATAGSTFTGWSGAGCSGTGTCQVTVNSDQTATATFTINPPVQRTLTAAKAGTGQGTITSSPAGINCGADCSEAYNDGTVVTLTATATAGSTFTGWSGAGCSGTGTCQVTVNSDQTATATFTINPPVQRTLTAAKAGTGQGTITSSPAGINCGADCQRGL